MLAERQLIACSTDWSARLKWVDGQIDTGVQSYNNGIYVEPRLMLAQSWAKTESFKAAPETLNQCRATVASARPSTNQSLLKFPSWGFQLNSFTFFGCSMLSALALLVWDSGSIVLFTWLLRFTLYTPTPGPAVHDLDRSSRNKSCETSHPPHHSHPLNLDFTAYHAFFLGFVSC